HSLSCNFIVRSHPKAGEHWCEGQCSVDGVPFLQYSKQGKEVNATKGCADLYPKLKDTGKELRTLLLHMEKEAVLTRDYHNLQGTMVSQYKPGQLIDASWNFTIDEKYSFCFIRYNQNNKKWEVINYNATGILEQWENNAELAQDLATLSMGDSDHCLKEILKHKKETPDAASLCYSFTVGKSGSGPWWHKVQGQLNEETFLSYNSINNCYVFGVLGNRLNATKICDKQVDTLKDGVDLLKQQVIRMNNIIRDAASLCYSLTVGKSGSGPWWHKVQGQLNEETFLSYNSINNCHVFGVLGNRLNATKICDKQVDTLKDGVDQIKQQVIHMKQEPRRTDPGFLQPLKRCISLL
ncbi:NKG2D ligand 4, partial [Cricetulus griseus]